MTEKQVYSFLLQHYSRVNEYLGSENPTIEDFNDILISFCLAAEKILKIKLHQKNPILIFDMNKIKGDDELVKVCLKNEGDTFTSKLIDIMKRFNIIYPNRFSGEEIQALLDIYNVRNRIMHSYKPDDQLQINAEDLTKKMGTVWEKLSDMAISLFGKDEIKKNIPKKKYSEQELERVLQNEVEEIISRPSNTLGILNNFSSYDSTVALPDGEPCPRCGAYGFSLGNNIDGWYAGNVLDSTMVSFMNQDSPNLYKCSKCNLELTKKQYEIARKIRNI